MLACGVCGTELHGRPASRRIADPDWVALEPKPRLRYADDTPEAIVAPDALVPFAVERATARRLLRDWARRRPFAPRELRRIDESTTFRAAFVPHWVWQARTRSRFKAARGEHYWMRVGAAGGKGSRVRALRWRPAAGTVDRDFTGVAIPATVRLEGRMLADLMRDWRLGNALPFRMEQLDGCWVQRYDLEPEVGLELAKARMAAAVEREVRIRVGGDEQHVPSIDTAYAGLGYRLVLLPVWLASYAHRGRRRMVAVHGESGRVLGERPWSAVKLGIGIFLMLAVSGLILYFSRLSAFGAPNSQRVRTGRGYRVEMNYRRKRATAPANRACTPRKRASHPRLRRRTPLEFRERQ
ncbi:hypothetical protein AB0B28_04430 [Glycomyces sp. NPDC046736]|uniref:hypothetical protein n=1 Tax=Glycomyces sp. NPDC046736 TaxID=3155615 RepID=UPI0033F901C7